MQKPKNRSLRFTDDDWDKLAELAEQFGCMNGDSPSRNAFIQAILDGSIPIGHQPESEIEKRLAALERRHETLSSSFADRGFTIERLKFEVGEIKRLGKFYF